MTSEQRADVAPAAMDDGKAVRRRIEWHAWLVVGLSAAIALASTTGVGIASSWYDEQRVLVVLALAAATLVGRTHLAGVHRAASRAILTVLAVGLVSALLASRPFLAVLDWSIYCLIALLVLSSRASRSEAVGTTAALAAVIVAASYVVGVLTNFGSSLLLDFPIGAETLLVGFSNPRFPAQLQALTIPFLPLAMARAPSSFWRACLAGVAALWWMCFIGSGSRTGWLAIAAAALVVSWLGVEGRRWLKWQAAFAVSGGALWWLLFHAVPSVLDIETATETGRLSNFASVGARWELWRLSAEASLAHPLLGLGPMHFAYTDNGLGAHPHNFWLQLAAEWGAPATLLVGAASVALAGRLWRSVRKEVDASNCAIGIAALAGVIAWGVGTLSDGYMVVPTSQAMSAAVLMLAVMWLRLAAASQRPTAADMPLTSSRIASWVARGLAVVALAVIASLPFTDFGQPTLRESVWRAERAGQTLSPRFWQQGWIGPDADPTARPEGKTMAPQR